MDWIQSVQRALNHIEAHLLDEDLDNDSVARHAYSSNANFQRIFSIVTGVPIADYIRCRKLTLAGEELVKSDAKIIDAAFKYGYDTPESFAKALTVPQRHTIRGETQPRQSETFHPHLPENRSGRRF